MKKYIGYFKAVVEIEVEDNATEEEIRAMLADKMSDEYFTCVSPKEVEDIEEVME